MVTAIAEYLGSAGFMPHGHCFLWTPSLLWLYAASDSVIALSYYAIPVALLIFVRRRPDVAFGWVFWLFGAFIFMCGTTHLLGVWTIWWPSYWLDGTVRAITAALSLGTAVTLYPLIPKALAVPSPAHMAAANEELRNEIAERRRTQAQLEATQEELVRKERLATLGQLAGGVSHELRNPLGVINNSVYYLRMIMPEDERAKKHLRILEREISTANRIVTGLLDFARIGRPAPVPTDLGRVVHDHIERAALPPSIELALSLADGLPPVQFDQNQLDLVLGNLVQNAVQAMPDGGRLAIATAREGASLTLTVSDTGPGIAPENIARIFEPLFTTKPRGIGLGLAVARGLVEANGATLTATSTPGHGARFVLTLPAVDT